MDGMRDTLNPDTIEAAAKAAHEINRTWCELNGDKSQVPWAQAPVWQQDSARAGVKAIWENPLMQPSASHVSWMKQKQEEGWTYGPVKDVAKKVHPCMVEYSELPKKQQAKDHLFGIVVRAWLGL